MKKIYLMIFCACTISFTACAQETKPTKEETITYIKNYFKPYFQNALSYTSFKYLEDPITLVKRCYKFKKFNIDNCILTFEYEEYYWNVIDAIATENAIITRTIDLSEVESINFISIPGNKPYGDSVGFMGFIMRGTDEELNNELPFIAIESENNKDIFNLQIFKAFNHLRTLCGGPEPIKFD